MRDNHVRVRVGLRTMNFSSIAIQYWTNKFSIELFTAGYKAKKYQFPDLILVILDILIFKYEYLSFQHGICVYIQYICTHIFMLKI